MIDVDSTLDREGCVKDESRTSFCRVNELIRFSGRFAASFVVLMT